MSGNGKDLHKYCLKPHFESYVLEYRKNYLRIKQNIHLFLMKAFGSDILRMTRVFYLFMYYFIFIYAFWQMLFSISFFSSRIEPLILVLRAPPLIF